jgi:uncharacterized tellurite resistance protein B-like protein
MEAGLVERMRQWFGTREPGEPELPKEELALAALLVEMMRADYASSPEERDAVLRVLERHFRIDRGIALRLLEQGERAADRAVSLFEHTRPLDVALGEDEKFAVVAALWEIALADGELDRHEDYLAHKLAELLHVRHSDLMRIKDEVRNRRNGPGGVVRSV